MRDNATAKREFIRAFFDDAEERAKYLLDLGASGRASEASTLFLVYIDSFSQWLFWPRSRAGQNFVEALVTYGGDTEFALVHPLALIRALAAMKVQPEVGAPISRKRGGSALRFRRLASCCVASFRTSGTPVTVPPPIRSAI
jgi:hypothetical protein